MITLVLWNHGNQVNDLHQYYDRSCYQHIGFVFAQAQALHFKTSTIVIYMILNSKGNLTGCGI